MEKTVANKKLEENYNELIATGYLRVDPEDNSELWRISLRVAAFQDVDYGQFADEVRIPGGTADGPLQQAMAER